MHGKVRSYGQAASGTNVARVGAVGAVSRLTPPLPGKTSPLSSCSQPALRITIKDAQGTTAPPAQIVCVSVPAAQCGAWQEPRLTQGWLGHRMRWLSATCRAFDSVGLFHCAPLTGRWQ